MKLTKKTTRLKIYYKTVFNEKSEIRSYNILKTEFCCEKMKEAWTEKAIQFGTFNDYLHNDLNTVNIATCHIVPGGASWGEFPITFCPFCQAEIECIEQEKGQLVLQTKQVMTEITDYIEKKVE